MGERHIVLGTGGEVYLPLGHSSQIAHAGATTQDPHQVGMGFDAALLKDEALLGVQANGEKTCQHLFAPFRQLSGVLLNSDGMEVCNGKEDLVMARRFLLQFDPLSQCTEVVAKMGHACGLDARKEYLLFGLLGPAFMWLPGLLRRCL